MVVYDSNGMFMLQGAGIFSSTGHMNVRMLDGGLPKWIAEINQLFLAINSSWIQRRAKGPYLRLRLQETQLFR